MINFRILYRTIGTLLFIEAVMMFVCFIMAMAYGEDDRIAMGVSFVVVSVIAIAMRIHGRHSGSSLNRRESFLIVATTWIVFSLLGMLPLLLSGYVTSVTDAFFETMSGFTTTGTSLISDIDKWPHSLLFWRTLTQWVGGLGIVFFTLAILPSSGNNGVRLFSAEVTGPTHERLHPRIRTTVKWLFSLYAILTLLCAVALYFCGVDWFDSINHAMATTATGGFSTHSDGIMFFNSAAVEYVIAAFMLVSGISFYMLYVMFQRRSLRPIKQSGELRFYLISILIISVMTAICLYIFGHYDIERAIRSAVFNVISMQSGTGFNSDNFQFWWRPLWLLLFFVMITGGCAGSTSGGIKTVRMLTLIKVATNQFQHMIHPNLVRPIRINGNILGAPVIRSLLAFVIWYLIIIVIAVLIFTAMGIKFQDAFNIVISCMSNVGAAAGPVYSPMESILEMNDGGKWLCSALMLAGRLEIFPLLLPLAPSFWKKN